MKVLWVSNSAIGPSSLILNEEYNGNSGGWIQSEFDRIKTEDNYFYFLCSSRSIKRNEIVHKKNDLGEVFCVHAPRLAYGIKNPNYLVKNIENIINVIQPDIIMIWGTETCISNIVANINTSCKKSIFIQGIIGIHARYKGSDYRSGLNKKYPVFRTLIEYILNKIQLKHFYKQIDIEKDTIKKCQNVICEGYLMEGYIRSFCNNVNFFQYKLLPNNVFLKKHWSFDNCEKHSIFTVFGSSIDKGVHQLLKAVSIVKKVFPDVVVKIPGPYHLDVNRQLKATTFYERVIYKIIKKENLNKNVVFLGKLNSKEMAEQMLSANCFVNPSIMENHALSLREAIFIGLPCITTDCGNVLDFISNGVNGYIYRFEEYEVLAFYIMRVLDGMVTFTRNEYLIEDNNLLDIYHQIVKGNGK